MTEMKQLETNGELAAAAAGSLHLSGGAAGLTIAGADLPDRLYQAHFRGLIPTVTDADGTVNVRYRRRLHPFAIDSGEGTMQLSSRVPWDVHVHDAAAHLTAAVTGLTLTRLTFHSAVADIILDLPRPVGEVTIRIDGPVRNLRLRRPAGIPVGVRIGGGASRMQIDGQELGATGGGYHNSAPVDPDHYILLISGPVDGLNLSH
jgi:hypothetical protein